MRYCYCLLLLTVLRLTSNSLTSYVLPVSADAESVLQVCGEVSASPESVSQVYEKVSAIPESVPQAVGRFRQSPKVCRRLWGGSGNLRKCAAGCGEVPANPESVSQVCRKVSANAESLPTWLGRFRQSPKVCQRGWEGSGKSRKHIAGVRKGSGKSRKRVAGVREGLWIFWALYLHFCFTLYIQL